MGVYYIIVNDTKREFIDPADFDENFKLSGIFQGVHGSAVAKMLCSSSRIVQYSFGYWSGDSIRVLGDNAPNDEYGAVIENYSNISFYALAYEFEESTKPIRDQIIERIKKSEELYQHLVEVNSNVKLANFNYSMNKLKDRDARFSQ